MAVDVLVSCGEEEHRVRLLPDDIVWPDSAHDADLEEGLVEMGAERPKCLSLRRAWLGMRKDLVFEGFEPFPYVMPLSPLPHVLEMGSANRYDRNEAIALLVADFLKHALDQAGVAEEHLKGAYAVVSRVRGKVFKPHRTTTASMRAATAVTRRMAEAHSYTIERPSLIIASLNRAANQLGLFAIGALPNRRGGYFGANINNTQQAIMTALAHQARSTQDMIDETVWQRHHALRAYEAMIEGKPWPST